MGEEKKKKIPLLIDTDLGDDIDDSAALIMALNSPELEIVAITTVFKDTRKRVEMVLDLLRQKEREDIPVIPGVGRAIVEATNIENPIQYEILKKKPNKKILRQYKEMNDMEAAQLILQLVKKKSRIW